MRTLNNEIEIQRGEAFTIDRVIENKDGSPYIISNKLHNPYFLLTIANSKYSQNNRYVKKYWLDLASHPRFLCTQPIDLFSIKVSATSDVNKYSAFPAGELLEGYVNGSYVQYDAEDAVFYMRNSDGTVSYKYFNNIVDGTGNIAGWTTYKCRLVKAFSSDDTSELVEQNYVYNIRLVSGYFSVDGKLDTYVVHTVNPILSATKLTVFSNIEGV